MLIEKIGKPAMLEQTAEECAELTQASLKLARYYRDENKVHGKTKEEMIDNLTEEMADVSICLSELLLGDEKLPTLYNSYVQEKMERMCKRLGIVENTDDNNNANNTDPDYKSFCYFVANEIFDENWEFNQDAFAEIACRKLVQLGIVELIDDKYRLKESQ
jgi:NTP pyrophosphatase (non-canonical NTP hydrolase)